MYVSFFNYTIFTNFLLKKIDRYLRNHSRCSQRVGRQFAVPPPVPRTVNWIQVMARDKKDIITAQANVLRCAEGVTSPADYLRFFERARQDLADSLPADQIEYYKELAEAESQVLKAPLTPGVMFRYVTCMITSSHDELIPSQSTVHSQLPHLLCDTRSPWVGRWATWRRRLLFRGCVSDSDSGN